MTDTASESGAKPATSARIYDYLLGGTHNFPADREAAQAVMQMVPTVQASARANRAFLGRAVRHLCGAGVRQFLDIGSGIPTQGNVHEVADSIADDCRVVYVDIDPVAVSESQEILERNDRATAVWGDLRDPQSILGNAQLRATIDLDRPVAVLFISMLHFVGDEVAYDAVAQIVSALAPGSYVALSHGINAEASAETDEDRQVYEQQGATATQVYRQSTATPLNLRTRADVQRFVDGLTLVEPGLVWVPSWRPVPDDPTDFADHPPLSGILAVVGRKD